MEVEVERGGGVREKGLERRGGERRRRGGDLSLKMEDLPG